MSDTPPSEEEGNDIFGPGGVSRMRAGADLNAADSSRSARPVRDLGDAAHTAIAALHDFAAAVKKASGSAAGTTGGGGAGRNGGDWSLPPSTHPQGATSQPPPDRPQRHNGGTGSGGRPVVDQAAQFAVMQQGASIVGAFGGAVGNYYDRQRPANLALAQTAQLGALYGGGSYRPRIRAMASGEIWGASDVYDRASLVRQQTLMFGGRQNIGQANQLGFANVINPMAFGSDTASAQAFGALMTPQSRSLMVPFGGGLFANGAGKMDVPGAVNRYIQAATGTKGYGGGRGQLSASTAAATFTPGDQGYNNLLTLGLSPELAQTFGMWAEAQAKSGGKLRWGNNADMRKAGLMDPFTQSALKREGLSQGGDVNVFDKSVKSLTTMNNALGEATRAAKETASVFGWMAPQASVFGKALSGASNLLVTLAGLKYLGGAGAAGNILNKIPGASRIPGLGGGGLSEIEGVGGLTGGAALLAAGGMFLGGQAVGTVLDHLGGTGKGGKRWLGRDAGTVAKYAGTGAALGSILPGPGTAVGAGIGAAVGVGHDVMRHLGLFGIGDAIDDIDLGPKGHNLNSQFARSLKQMFKDNPKLVLNSGWRSKEQQQVLYDAYRSGKGPTAAKPGTSRHEKGLAADIGPASQYGWLANNVGRYGLVLAVNGEPWHVEPMNAKAMSGVVPTAEAEPPGGADSGSNGGTSAIEGLLPHYDEKTTGSAIQIGGPGYSVKAAGTSSSGAKTDSGTSAGGSAPTGGGGGGGGLTNDSLVAVLRQAGFSGQGLRMAYAEAMAESHGQAHGPDNVNHTKGPDNLSHDRGLFQINSYWHPEVQNVYDALANAKAAYGISHGGTDWSQWSTYKSGAYTKYLRPDIGDNIERVESGRGNGGLAVSAPTSISVGAIHLTLKTETVSEAEARRLVNLMKAEIMKDQRKAKVRTN